MIIWHNFRKITNDCTATLKRCLYPFVLFYCHTFPYFIDFRDCHFRFANDSWTSVRHTYKPPHQSAAITEYKYSSDAVPPIYAVSYHVATDKPPPPKMSASSGLFLARIYNQSQLAKRKHAARYWSIDTTATAVPLSPHPSAITKLAAAILGGRLFGESVLPAQYCPCGRNTAFPCSSLPLLISSRYKVGG